MTKDISRRAIAHYGAQTQVRKAIEELTELSLALQRSLECRGNNDNVREEMADVKVIMFHLEIIYGDPSEWVAKKTKRLVERMERKC